MLYQVQRQCTAGAYRAIATFTTHEKAVAYLEEIAASSPKRLGQKPYDGGDKWQDSTNPHNVNRYRITTIEVDIL